LALGVFLIAVGMSIDFRELLRAWPQLLGALVLVLVIKVIVTGVLLRLAGSRTAVAAETAWLMASPLM
jgi:CPA2 family monovalent cation:H+ antiporter-2